MLAYTSLFFVQKYNQCNRGNCCTSIMEKKFPEEMEIENYGIDKKFFEGYGHY